MRHLLFTAMILALAACSGSSAGKCSNDSGCGAGASCQAGICVVKPSNVLLRGGIGNLGPATDTGGNVKLVNQGLSITGGGVCNGSVCLKNGGIAP